MTDIHDDWTTSSSEEERQRTYEPTKFYIRSADNNGHAAKIQVKLVPGDAAIVARWVNDPATPYRSMQDFLRDAVYHRAHQLTDALAGGYLDAELRNGLLVAKMERETMQRADRVKGLEDFRSGTREMLIEGRVDDCAMLCDQMDENIEAWPPEPRRLASRLISTVRGDVRRAYHAGLDREPQS